VKTTRKFTLHVYKWLLNHCLPTITHTEIHGGTSSWRVCAGPECQQESLDDNFHSWLYNRSGKGLGQYAFEALILYKWAVCRSNDDPGQSHHNHLCQRTMAKWRQWLWVACASISYINMWRPWPSNHPVWSATDMWPPSVMYHCWKDHHFPSEILPS